MMREVVTRRYSRLISENGELPDLVLIDGGEGHLAAVRGVLDGLGLEGVPAAGIAKEYNHLYVDKKDHPLRLSPGSRLLFLIQRIRDEAHRVAVQYHRKLRSKEAFL
jgi:excinuclease ABC subunit C